MLHSTRGILFRRLKYGDTSLIVDIYTEALGLRSYLVSGSRKAKSRFPASLLQPMNMLDLVVYDKQGRSLNRIREMRLDTLYERIPFQVERSAIGLFLIEVARRCVIEEEPNKDLFDFLYRTFRFLDTTDQTLSNIPSAFLVDFSAHLGFAPSLPEGAEREFFDLKDGRFVGHFSQSGYVLNGEESIQLMALIKGGVERAHELQIGKKERRSLLDQLLLFYQLHVENLPKIRTAEIYRDIF